MNTNILKTEEGTFQLYECSVCKNMCKDEDMAFDAKTCKWCQEKNKPMTKKEFWKKWMPTEPSQKIKNEFFLDLEKVIKTENIQ